VASTRVQGWGDETPKGVGYGDGVPSHRGRDLDSGEAAVKILLFCDLEMTYFGEF